MLGYVVLHSPVSHLVHPQGTQRDTKSPSTLVAVVGPQWFPPTHWQPSWVPQGMLGHGSSPPPPPPYPVGHLVPHPPHSPGGPSSTQAENVPQGSRRPHHLLHGRHLGLHLGAAPMSLEGDTHRETKGCQGGETLPGDPPQGRRHPPGRRRRGRGRGRGWGARGGARGRRCQSSSPRKGAKGARRRSPSSAQLSRVRRVSAAVAGSRRVGLAVSCGRTDGWWG